MKLNEKRRMRAKKVKEVASKKVRWSHDSVPLPNLTNEAPELFIKLADHLWPLSSKHNRVSKRELKCHMTANILVGLFKSHISKTPLRIHLNRTKISNFNCYKKAVELLEEEKLMRIYFKGYHNRKTGKGETTRIIPTPKLRHLFRTISILPSDGGIADNGDAIVLRDEEKNRIPFKMPRSLKAREKQINEYNKFLSKQSIGIYHFSDRSREGEEGAGEHVKLAPQVRSIFNGNFEHGGRLYSFGTGLLNYQNIEKWQRRHITINGEKTAEVDYAALHATMLYAKLNIPLPDGGPYAIYPRQCPKLRKLIKVALNTMFNAKSKEEAVKSLNHEQLCISKGMDEKNKEKALKTKAFLDKKKLSFQRIVEAIAQKHKAISQFFFQGKGLELQKEDSDLMLEILLYFQHKNIPVLPVHDSIIIPASKKTEASLIMRKLFRQRYGRDIETH